MTEPSLFGDYPNPTAPAPSPPTCGCDLDAPLTVAPRVWAMLHTLGHSRIPFTITTFQGVAACTQPEAHRALEEGRQRGWVCTVWPEPYMTVPLEQWVGCLSKRRTP